jgi:hypothetical protein
MLRDTSVAVLLTVVLCAGTGRSQISGSWQPVSEQGLLRAKEPMQTLSSPSVAARLWDIAHEVSQAESISGPQAEQAIILLSAAARLDGRGRPVEPLLLKLACRQTGTDYSDQVVLWLQSYVGESCDPVIVRDAVDSLLSRQRSWEGRRTLLEDLASRLGNKNPVVDSDLATRLGFLMGEKSDVEKAKFYLMQAYKTNKHNKVAFAKLAEIAPDDIGPGIYLEHLRLVLQENPLDLTAAMNFAQYAERLQLYDTASLSYQYSAELFRYLYPTEPLPPHIYLPWAISSYNTDRGQPVAMQIAENVREGGRFDILLEAIASRAAARTGNSQEAQRLCRQAEETALRLLQAGSQGPSAQPGGVIPVRPLTPRQLAWFYCFADRNPQKALEWANRAYSTEPNVPAAGALLAYALTMNSQMEWAKSLLPSCGDSQIADLVQARMQMAVNSNLDAVQSLKQAIARDAGSLAAEQAREMLRDLQSEYTPPIDTKLLMSFLTQSLGQAVIPQFVPPEKMIHVEFSVGGSEFAYGSEIAGAVTILNRGIEPLWITEDGLFKGNVRVDARVSGGLQREIAAVVSQTIHTTPAVQPGKSVVIPLKLLTGKLRELLETYPQASLQIEFSLYLDPVVAESGAVGSRLAALQPTPLTVRRPGVDISSSYIRSRFNAISTGQQEQKIATAQLFTGLLKEQCAMAGRDALYPFRYAEWMPGLLRSALTGDPGLLLGGGQDDWIVAVHTMADMLSMPIDEQLAAAVARDLNHPKWPVRLMAIYLLANAGPGDFQQVLDWFARNDASEFVRLMAGTLRSDPSVTATVMQPRQ